MSAVRAAGRLRQRHLDTEWLAALQKVVHVGHEGGMHTNGGCRDGRCDYGAPACRAFTTLMRIVVEELPDMEWTPEHERGR